MIRLIQRHLIIPRGDTGKFTLPVTASINTGDVAIFTIFNLSTRKKLFTKIVNVTSNTIAIEFSHSDTVNLPVGKYVWDVKFYKNATIDEDGQVINGDEVDSYYSAYTLPVCEIRPTGDLLLTADDAPTSTVNPEQLNVITSAANLAQQSAQAAAEAAETAIAALSSLTDLTVDVTTLSPGESATGSYDHETGILSLGLPQGEDGVGIQSVVQNSDSSITITDTEGNAYTTQPLKGDAYILTSGDEREIAGITQQNIRPIIDYIMDIFYREHNLLYILDPYNEFIVKDANDHDTVIVKGPSKIEVDMVNANEGWQRIYLPVSGLQEPFQNGHQYKFVLKTNNTANVSLGIVDSVSHEYVDNGTISIDDEKYTTFTYNENNFINSTPQLALVIKFNGTYTATGKYYFYDITNVIQYATIDDLNGKADKADTILLTSLSRGRAANTIIGEASFAFGNGVTASGFASHAEGIATVASGEQAHAEGDQTVASGTSSHAEGKTTSATGFYSHSEGSYTVASDQCSHAEGYMTYAKGVNSHAEGIGTGPEGTHSFMNGVGTVTGIAATGLADHTEGYYTQTVQSDNYPGTGNHAEGYETVAGNTTQSVYGAHAEGLQAIASASAAHAEGKQTQAPGEAAHAEGVSTQAVAFGAHAEGVQTHAIVSSSHAEGNLTVANAIAAHAEGKENIASGGASHAEGDHTTAAGYASHAEGYSSVASNSYAHAEGRSSALGYGSHAEGLSTSASSYGAHSEGYITSATGTGAHSEGHSTVVNGTAAHAEGFGTKATGEAVHAGGKFNVDLNASSVTMAQIIGNGTSDDNRSNAYALSWTGDGYYKGDVYVNCDANSANGTKVATVNDLSDLSDSMAATYYTKPSGGIPATDLAETYITTETDPTVPAWAKAAQKPSYTASEVGATTEQQVSSMIASAIGNINSFDMAVVRTLPTENISNHTIYLVPKTGETNDVYDEYIYINDAWEMIGNTQIDLSNYVQKTDYATASTGGVVKVSGLNGIGINEPTGHLYVAGADSTLIKSGSGNYFPIVPTHQHESTFYGLAKAAGADEKNSTESVGTYSAAAKTAIQTMLDVPAKADVPTNISDLNNDSDFMRQYYGVCNTDGATAAKQVTISNLTSITTGTTILVKFNAANTASGPKLEINSGEQIPIYRGTSAVGTSANTSWPAGSVVQLTYDGTNWIIDNYNNTISSSMTDAQVTAGTSTSSLLISPARVKLGVETHAPVKSVNGQTGTVQLNAVEYGNFQNLTAAEQQMALTNLGLSNEALPISDDLYKSRVVSGGEKVKIDQIVGGTVAWNQLVDTATTSVTVASGHKYVALVGGTWSVGTSDGTALTVTGGTDMVFDLTQMFGATVAQHFLDLETATPGAGVALFRAMFPESYYPYNAGELVSVQTSGRKTVGFNQWDEVWGAGKIDHTTGEDSQSGHTILSINFIPVIAGATYYSTQTSAIHYYDSAKRYTGEYDVLNGYNRTFTVPQGCSYIRFSTTTNYGNVYKHDICINISDPSRNGTYEPYSVHTYPLDSTLTLRGIPVLSGGVPAYDGDKYAPDGTVTRRYGIVDLGTLNWTKEENDGSMYNTTGVTTTSSTTSTYANILCPKYVTDISAGGNAGALTRGDKTIFARTNGTLIWIRDSAYTGSTASEFKASLSGVYLVYELATPTTESADPYAAIQDAGTTEEFLGTSVPVGAKDCYYCAQSVVDVKADKVQNATSGNFAALDSEGNLVDSGHKHSDYLTEHQSLSNYVQKTDLPNGMNAGVVRVANVLGVDIVSGYGMLTLTPLTHDLVKSGDCIYAVSPTWQHESAFYGLAKAAGDTTQASSSNAVGTYTTEAKAAIRSMIGAAASADVTVQDVQANGTSVVSNGVANIPKANETTLGLVKIFSQGGTPNGIGLESDGSLITIPADSSSIKGGAVTYRPITPVRQHEAIFYGLAKAAGTDMKNSNNAVGTYTDAAKGAIQKMLGVTDLFGNEENGITASRAYTAGEAFVADGKLYRTTAAIAQDGAIVTDGNGANCVEISVTGDYVKRTDIANSTTPGVMKVTTGGLGLVINADKVLQISPADAATIKDGTQGYRPITPQRQHESVFYGLAKAAGADMKSSSNAVGTYTDEAKTAIRTMLGAIGNTDYATDSIGGVVKILPAFGISSYHGYLSIAEANDNAIKTGVGNTAPITAAHQHQSVFYGLAKAAGDTTQSASDNAVGTYTDDAKVAIRTMLGTVGNTDYATSSTPGVVKTSQSYGTTMTSGALTIAPASNDNIKGGTNAYKPIVPAKQDQSVFYGLAKVAGVDLASETVTLGTYPAAASAAIRTMLGAAASSDITVTDVQIKNASIVSSGIASIPMATNSVPGLIVTNGTDYGIWFDNTHDNRPYISRATDTNIKAADNAYKPIVSQNQHQAVFYGLAKAAGDTTQSSSSNAVGSYTAAAKTAIQSMLGIDTGVVEEYITGTDVTITALPNTRYVCDTVNSITITPCNSGTCEFVFTSGTSVALLTVPNTISWPEWFDPTSLDTNTIYDIIITNGELGAVMSWEK